MKSGYVMAILAIIGAAIGMLVSTIKGEKIFEASPLSIGAIIGIIAGIIITNKFQNNSNKNKIDNW